MLSDQPSNSSEQHDAGLTLIGLIADGDGVRVRFAGEVDISTESRFVEYITDVLRAGAYRRLCVDLSEVRFLDSSGIRALLLCWRSAQADGRSLVVTGLQPIVRRALEVTGVLTLLTPTSAEDLPAVPLERQVSRPESPLSGAPGLVPPAVGAQEPEGHGRPSLV